jgi:RHS repeat-associated protein
MCMSFLSRRIQNQDKRTARGNDGDDGPGRGRVDGPGGTGAGEYRFTGKERDEETGLYYYGARYLDGKASMWLPVDPALGEYLPEAPVDEEARESAGDGRGVQHDKPAPVPLRGK